MVLLIYKSGIEDRVNMKRRPLGTLDIEFDDLIGTLDAEFIDLIGTLDQTAAVAPSGVNMLYEDNIEMEFEDGVVMQ